MKERPILFSGQMVKAILDYTKTQTRRAIKLDPVIRKWRCTAVRSYLNPENEFDQQVMASESPYGQPGDRLWVRETFCDNGGDEFEYRATSSSVAGKWSPAIHMPRRASRISLQIIGVR